jgi:hypothetical protein
MARDRGNSNTYSMSRVSLLFEYPCLRSPFSSHLEAIKHPESRRVLNATAFGPLLHSDFTPFAWTERRGKAAQMRHCTGPQMSLLLDRISVFASRAYFHSVRKPAIAHRGEAAAAQFLLPLEYLAGGRREADGGGCRMRGIISILVVIDRFGPSKN